MYLVPHLYLDPISKVRVTTWQLCMYLHNNICAMCILACMYIIISRLVPIYTTNFHIGDIEFKSQKLNFWLLEILQTEFMNTWVENSELYFAFYHSYLNLIFMLFVFIEYILKCTVYKSFLIYHEGLYTTTHEHWTTLSSFLPCRLCQRK